MKRINIVVEGQTEEDFVNAVLAQPFAQKQIYLTASQVETGRKHGKVHKGGATNYLKIRCDILNWLKQDQQALTTMMFDFYALPDDFPAYTEAKQQNDPYQRITQLEEAIFNDLSNQLDEAPGRFIPYIQLYEFEALLFSDPNRLSEGLSLYNPVPSLETKLSKILAQAGNNPELINDDPSTAPSKRLINLCGAYSKPLLGILIAEDIGLSTLRGKCRHFNELMTKLEEGA